MRKGEGASKRAGERMCALGVGRNSCRGGGGEVAVPCPQTPHKPWREDGAKPWASGLGLDLR